MALYRTSVKNRKLKLDQWAQRLQGLESSWEGGTLPLSSSFFSSPSSPPFLFPHFLISFFLSLVDSSAWLKARGVEPTKYDAGSLGTIGAGNHFAELQQVRFFFFPSLLPLFCFFLFPRCECLS